MFMATANDPAVRDPSAAVALAEEACRISGRKDPELLRTLAVAYTAAGRPRDAADTAGEAVALAPLLGTTRARKRDRRGARSPARPRPAVTSTSPPSTSGNEANREHFDRIASDFTVAVASMEVPVFRLRCRVSPA